MGTNEWRLAVGDQTDKTRNEVGPSVNPSDKLGRGGDLQGLVQPSVTDHDDQPRCGWGISCRSASCGDPDTPIGTNCDVPSTQQISPTWPGVIRLRVTGTSRPLGTLTRRRAELARRSTLSRSLLRMTQRWRDIFRAHYVASRSPTAVRFGLKYVNNSTSTVGRVD